MKKSFLLINILICIKLIAQQGDLPYAIDSSFAAKYPGAVNVNWYTDNFTYKIEFEAESIYYTAVYLINGQWLRTSSVLEYMQIPVYIKKVISEEYPELEISDAEYIENNANEKFYRINAYSHTTDYYIDVSPEGKILNVDAAVVYFDFYKK